MYSLAARHSQRGVCPGRGRGGGIPTRAQRPPPLCPAVALRAARAPGAPGAVRLCAAAPAQQRVGCKRGVKWLEGGARGAPWRRRRRRQRLCLCLHPLARRLLPVGPHGSQGNAQRRKDAHANAPPKVFIAPWHDGAPGGCRAFLGAGSARATAAIAGHGGTGVSSGCRGVNSGAGSSSSRCSRRRRRRPPSPAQ